MRRIGMRGIPAAVIAGGLGFVTAACISPTPATNAASVGTASGALRASARPMPSAAASAGTVPACRDSDLRVTSPWSLQGGMGGIVVAVVFRNAGTQTCSFVGWPTVEAQAMQVKVLYTTVTAAGFATPVTRVVLAPGDSAASSLNLFGKPGSVYGEQCSESGSWTVRIPGTARPMTVKWVPGNGPCAGGTVFVSPFYKGAAPEIGFGSADPQSIPMLGPYSSPPSTF